MTQRPVNSHTACTSFIMHAKVQTVDSRTIMHPQKPVWKSGVGLWDLSVRMVLLPAKTSRRWRLSIFWAVPGPSFSDHIQIEKRFAINLALSQTHKYLRIQVEPGFKHSTSKTGTSGLASVESQNAFQCIWLLVRTRLSCGNAWSVGILCVLGPICRWKKIWGKIRNFSTKFFDILKSKKLPIF